MTEDRESYYVVCSVSNFHFIPIYFSLKMTDLFRELIAPNGHKYIQPLGLFINNEFLESSDNGSFDAYNPALVALFSFPQPFELFRPFFYTPLSDLI